MKTSSPQARGLKVESRPNLHVDFPPAFDKQHPETIIKQIIRIDLVVSQIRPYDHGQTISVQLPADKLAKVASWGIDNDQDHFEMIGEKLHFWTTFKPSSAPFKSSVKVKENINLDQLKPHRRLQWSNWQTWLR